LRRKSRHVRLLEAREAADKQMRLLSEMHEMAACCRELETEKSVRREVEEHQVSLAWINSGRAERGRQRSVVQRELERQRSSSVARVGFAESPPSTRASTPSPPQAFWCDSERDNDAAIVVSCARPSAVQLATVEQSADSIEQPRLGRPSSEPESIHPVQLSMIQTSADVTVASTPIAAVASDGAGNPSVIPPGYMLIPITPVHPAPVGAGVGVSAVPGPTPGPTTVGMGVGSVEMAPVPGPSAVFVGDNPATSTFVCVANSASVGGCLIASEPARIAPPVVNPQASAVPVGGVVMSTLPITASVGLGGNVGHVSSSVLLTATSAASVTDAQTSVSSSSVTTSTSTATTSTPVVPGITAPVAPTAVVKQLQPVRSFNGSTPWRTFREQYTRIARVNGQMDLVQYLTLALEGPAAEVLKDFDDSTETAYEDLWKRIEHRFGDVDEGREAQRKFGNRRQTDSESLQEYEQALRTLYKQGWPPLKPGMQLLNGSLRME